ncbi:sensor histidine kinase [Kitasatospora phosalacinea]|uniref:sensor histidine kinase n=1 Tax=Kitasatospora phosalacinea TaxID=2065 RepID=UPI00364F15C6
MPRRPRPVLPRLPRLSRLSRLPRRTVRLRMTLLYGGLFSVSGAVLLAVTYALVRAALAGTPVRGLATGPTGPGPGVPPPTEAPPTGAPLDAGTDFLPAPVAEAVARQKAVLLHQLLVQSGIALVLMSVLSVALGWVVAGRMLRPLRTVTATARDISATSLHRRLALTGPPDELRELGDTFDGLLGRLEAAFLSQRRFVANASHELRTPLARQRALGQVALADPEPTVESLREAHERILAAGTQQERLIEALLTLARGQAGIEVREPFDLAALADDVVGARRAQARRQSVLLRSTTGPAVAAGHRPLAERLLANLVDNALRHNLPDGRVDVTTRTVDGRAVLVVSNTGPTVPPDQVERLFQPFQRLDATRAARTEGLGLGLSIVRAIAEAHDADLRASPGPHGGLTVTVQFPTPTTS